MHPLFDKLKTKARQIFFEYSKDRSWLVDLLAKHRNCYHITFHDLAICIYSLRPELMLASG